MKTFRERNKLRSYRTKDQYDSGHESNTRRNNSMNHKNVKRYQSCCTRNHVYCQTNKTKYKTVNRFYTSNRRWKQSFDKMFKDPVIVNPKDPLNLKELEKEQEERLNMGLSPLPGDSAFNTPVIYSDTNNLNINFNSNISKSLKTINDNQDMNIYDSSRGDSRFNVYFNGYHFKTKPEDRLKYFLPDWFEYSCICDYGCHRGDFSFKLFERFHNRISKLDCIDVRKNCIINAKHIQREKMRCEIMRQIKYDCNNNNNSMGTIIDYSKIHFKCGNWVKDREWSDNNSMIEDNENSISNDNYCEYDIIIALGVTKLIHLYYGDNGLEKFLRRACYRLKPGGHLIVELQSRSKYIEAVRDIDKPFIAKNFKSIKIQPDKLEPLLASVGFPYCCKINTERWNRKNGQGDILLCTKPIGTTPVPIRDTNTSEMMLKYMREDVNSHSIVNQDKPPSVIYTPCSIEPIFTADEFAMQLNVNPITTDDEVQVPDSTVNDEEEHTSTNLYS